jgi:hypothetical protein
VDAFYLNEVYPLLHITAWNNGFLGVLYAVVLAKTAYGPVYLSVCHIFYLACTEGVH